MTSATGNTGRARRGFSLIEIVMVLGLIAVASTVVIINFNAMTGRGDVRSNEEILTEAIQAGRMLAARERQTVGLRYAAETASLILQTNEADTAVYPLGPPMAPRGKSAVRFYVAAPEKGIRAPRIEQNFNQAIDTVYFSPDRSGTAFVAEIDQVSGAARRLRIDPFTGLPRTPSN